MSLAWIIYLADISDSLKLFFLSFSIVSVIFFIPGIPIILTEVEFSKIIEPKKLRKIIKYWVLITILFFSISLILPSEKTIYMMTTVSATKTAIATDEGQKIIKLINLEIDDKLKKLNDK